MIKLYQQKIEVALRPGVVLGKCRRAAERSRQMDMFDTSPTFPHRARANSKSEIENQPPQMDPYKQLLQETVHGEFAEPRFLRSELITREKKCTNH